MKPDRSSPAPRRSWIGARLLVRLPRLRAALLGVFALGPAASVPAQSTLFEIPDVVASPPSAHAYDVSHDGSVIVGSLSLREDPADPTRVEAYRWTEETGSVPLGDLPGGDHLSQARGVSANGRYVCGFGFVSGGREAFLWSREEGLVSIGELPGSIHDATAYAVSNDGNTVVGSSYSFRTYLNDDRRWGEAYRWTRGGGMQGLGYIDGGYNGIRSSVAWDVTPSGDVIVGTSRAYFGADPWNDSESFRWTTDDPGLNTLGQLEGRNLLAKAVSADGRVIVGDYACPQGDGASTAAGSFRWRQGRGVQVLTCDGGFAVDVSADGRVTLGREGQLWLEDAGPFLLTDILEAQGIDRLSEYLFFIANAISGDGLTVVGTAIDSEGSHGFVVRLSDCNENGVPDELEALAVQSVAAEIASGGSELFRAERGEIAYRTMVSAYGRPWEPGTDRTPSLASSEPASRIRVVAAPPVCGDVETIESVYLGGLVPAARELIAHEMLLGNEAYADAMDPTVGLDGVPLADVGRVYAFEGVDGIDGPIDEELALLRGRELEGDEFDRFDEEVAYPEFEKGGEDPVRAAIYHRLPPNTSTVAYAANYGVSDDHEAARLFPQGHGDAYGYYLRAVKAGYDIVRPATPAARATVSALIEYVASDAEAVSLLGEWGGAMVSRARAGRRIVDLTYRRDYREDPQDPEADRLFVDPDPENAGSMADWARRTATGAYLDWAVLSHVTPERSAIVTRDDSGEIVELARAVEELQSDLDAAGAGLDPLGLVQNVVPFGIDATDLDAETGRSHYEQVRDAAQRAIDNARSILEWANLADQRLEAGLEDRDAFERHVEEEFEDFNRRLAEIFGYPSPDDPLDNDRDPTTSDEEESRFRPDLVHFLLSDDEIARRGWAPRAAPGEIQLAMSELRVAELRIREAEFALDNLSAESREQAERIELLTGVAAARLEIIAEACDQQMELTRRLEDIENRKKSAGFLTKFVTAIVTQDPAAALDLFTDILGEVIETGLAAVDGLGTEWDVEVERQRVQCWKEAQLAGLEDTVVIDAEQRRLRSLMRQSPQLVLELALAGELASQSMGRLAVSIQRGQVLLRERARVERLLEEDLLDERWRDLAFRVFRSSALEKYDGFFDLAARYVVLAARAYAYEFNARAYGESVLSGIYRERSLGLPSGVSGGLESVLFRLDASVTVNNFNRPLESLGQRTFSLRRNLLGIGSDDFPNDDLAFRAWMESRIVDRVQDIPELRDLAQLSVQRDYGPGIVIPFGTEIDGRNFFGMGPEPPFGNTNFSITRNAKIRSFAVRFDGVDSSLGIDPENGTVFVYLLPVGDSVLRENNNRPRIEDEPAVPWSVVAQWLPVPTIATPADWSDPSYSPWRSTAQSAGNYLSAIKRFRDAEAQVELGQDLHFNSLLAGRSAWNTRWLLVVPGSQWTSSTSDAAIRSKLEQFIYGPSARPDDLRGITDVRLVIRAYSH